MHDYKKALLQKFPGEQEFMVLYYTHNTDTRKPSLMWSITPDQGHYLPDKSRLTVKLSLLKDLVQLGNDPGEYCTTSSLNQINEDSTTTNKRA